MKPTSFTDNNKNKKSTITLNDESIDISCTITEPYDDDRSVISSYKACIKRDAFDLPLMFELSGIYEMMRESFICNSCIIKCDHNIDIMSIVFHTKSKYFETSFDIVIPKVDEYIKSNVDGTHELSM